MREWHRELQQGLLRVLDWSRVDKGLLVTAALLPFALQYWLWAVHALGRADAHELIDIAFYRSQQPVFLLLLLATCAMLATGIHLRKTGRHDSRAYEAGTMLFFTAVLLYFGWLVGPLVTSAGIVLIGAPLVGFLLLDRRIVAVCWALALATMVILSVGAAAGYLEYGPLLVHRPLDDPQYGLYWTLTYLFWALPPIVATSAVAWFLLSRWREREDAFRTQSMTDMLTGVHNRRSALQILEREVARMRRRGPPLTVLLVDLDHFKSINDRWGHAAGDRVLQAAACALQHSVREYDTVGRWGGEEFILILPDTTPDIALMLAERCRARLEALALHADDGEQIPLTGSFGFSCNVSALDVDAATMVAHADAALYRAKQAGRNRVEAALPVPDGTAPALAGALA